MLVAGQLLNPLERVAIEPVRPAQPLGEQPQPLLALIISQHRRIGGRDGARGRTLHVVQPIPRPAARVDVTGAAWSVHRAGIWAATIRQVRRQAPACKVEVLTPDFRGQEMPLARVLAERPDVFNHNVETVPRLYSIARRGSTWERSNRVLRTAKEFGGDEVATKSGLMVGLGERFDEVVDALGTLRESGVQIITDGQYLGPTARHLSIVRYWHPDEFKAVEEAGYALGFDHIAAGPLAGTRRPSLRHWARLALLRDRRRSRQRFKQRPRETVRSIPVFGADDVAGCIEVEKPPGKFLGTLDIARGNLEVGDSRIAIVVGHGHSDETTSARRFARGATPWSSPVGQSYSTTMPPPSTRHSAAPPGFLRRLSCRSTTVASTAAKPIPRRPARHAAWSVKRTRYGANMKT